MREFEPNLSMRTRPERPFKRSWQQTEPNARLLNPSPKEAWRSNSVRTEAWCLRETLEHLVVLDADVRLVVTIPFVPSCFMKEQNTLVDGYKIVTTIEFIAGKPGSRRTTHRSLRSEMRCA